MKRLRLNQNGLTLVELLVTCTVISIVSIILMNFMANWLQQHAITQTRTAMLSDAQTALDIINDTIRQSAAADQNNRWRDDNAPGAPEDLQSWQSNNSTLVLASAVEDTNGNIVFSDPANYTSQKNNQVFYVNSGSLYRRLIAAPDVANNKLKTSCPEALATASCQKDRKMVSNVKNFTVSYLNADNQVVSPANARSIELSITLEQEKYHQTLQEIYKTRMVFRND